MVVTLSILIHEEQVQGLGEDAQLNLIGPNGAIAACMDGCGGSGGEQYPQMDGWTGAKIASRKIGNAIADWFSRDGSHGLEDKTAAELMGQMKQSMEAALKTLSQRVEQKSSVMRSTMSRAFPTTVAGALIAAAGRNRYRCIFFWAGDSRVFLFRVSGLQQMSRDDIRGGDDPFDALENDGRLSNVICADRPFQIRYQETFLEEPCMVLSATDGCFSYFLSPMHLEEALLETLMASKTPLDWQDRLKGRLGAAASDDYTMQISVLGFRNFRAIQTTYGPRWKDFQETYGKPLSKALKAGDREGHLALWTKYRQNYLPPMERGSV